MGDAGGAGIPGPAIGLSGGARGEVGSEEGMQAGSRIIGDLAEADAPTAAILDLDGADHQHFALMAAAAATADWNGFTATGDFGFIHLDEAGGGPSGPWKSSLAMLLQVILAPSLEAVTPGEAGESPIAFARSAVRDGQTSDRDAQHEGASSFWRTRGDTYRKDPIGPDL